MEIGSFPPMSTRPKKKVSDPTVSGHVQCSKEIVRRDREALVVVLGSLSMAPSFACCAVNFCRFVLGLDYIDDFYGVV